MATPSRLIRRQQTPERPVDVPYGIRLAAAWSWRILVIAGGAALLLWLAVQVSVVTIAVVIAVLLTALLAPMARLYRRTGMPSLLAAGLTIITTLVAVVGLFALVGQRMAASFADLRDSALDGFEQIQTWLAEGPFHIDESQLNDYIERVQTGATESSDILVSGALAATTTIGQVVTGFFLALFATLFFLGDGQRIWGWLVSLMPAASREQLDGAARRAWVTLTAYIRATIMVAVVDAVGIGLGALILLGPSLAIPIAVLVFLTAFVPIVGAIFSGAVAVLVGLVTQGPVVALLMLIVVIAVQQLESNVLQPVLLGRAVSVHPLAVALAVTCGIIVAGVVGALFAVPLIAVLNTVGRYLSGRDVAEEEPDGDGGGGGSGGPGGSGDGAGPVSPSPAQEEERLKEAAPAGSVPPRTVTSSGRVDPERAGRETDPD